MPISSIMYIIVKSIVNHAVDGPKKSKAYRHLPSKTPHPKFQGWTDSIWFPLQGLIISPICRMSHCIHNIRHNIHCIMKKSRYIQISLFIISVLYPFCVISCINEIHVPNLQYHVIWVNYNISLTWILGPCGDDFPIKTMITQMILWFL